MRTVFKYPLEIANEQTIDLPIGAKPLSVQMQGEWIYLWAEVDTDSKPFPYTVRVFGMGHLLPKEAMKHLGTVQQLDGMLVWHVYIML